MQLQIRSADEPSEFSAVTDTRVHVVPALTDFSEILTVTTFYRCTNAKCAYQWREA